MEWDPDPFPDPFQSVSESPQEDMCFDTQHLLNCVRNLCDIHFQRRDVTKTGGVLDLVHSAESQVPVPCLHTRLQSDADSDSDAFSFKLLAVLDSQSWPVWDYGFPSLRFEIYPELWRSNFGDRTVLTHINHWGNL